MFKVLVGRLDFCNLIDVLERYCPCHLVSGLAGTLFDACSFFEEIGSWRSFRDEGEGPIRLDGYEGRNGDPRFNVRCPCVEFLAEIHRLDTTSTEGRTNRWCRSRFPCLNEDALSDGKNVELDNTDPHKSKELTTT